MSINKYSSNQSSLGQEQYSGKRQESIFIQKIKKLSEWYKKDDQYQMQQKKQCPPYSHNINYHQEFWNIYNFNQALIQQIKKSKIDNQKATEQLQQLQILNEQIFNRQKIRKKKKNRRPAVQIAKNYKCPYLNCYKNYGSDVSMNLHIKIKHDGGNKTQRQKLAKQIVIAEKTNRPLPEIKIKFPPNYIQQYRAQMLSQELKNNVLNQEIQ